MCLTKDIEEDFDRPVPPQPPQLKGENYLLVVGINYQETSFRKLNNAVADAAAFLNVVLDRYNFFDPRTAKTETPQEIDTPQTTFLIDPSKAKLNKKIAELAQNLAEEDNLLIYFAGHGVKDATGFYFIPADGKKGDSDTWIDIEKLTIKLTIVDADGQQQRCRHLLLILDCCYSASALRGFSNRGTRDFSRYVIASAVDKATDGVINQGSPFRLALCELLSENYDHFYTINEDVLSKKLRKHTAAQNIKHEQSLRSGMIPSRYDNGSGRFSFELREPNVPPVAMFCKTYVKYLNFEKERTQFTDEIVDCEDRRIGIINLHENHKNLTLLKKALREEITKYYDGYAVVNKLKIDSSSLTNDIWQHLYSEKYDIRTDEVLIDNTLKEEILLWLFAQVSIATDHYPHKSGGVSVLNIILADNKKFLANTVKGFCKDIIALHRSIKYELGTDKLLLIIISESQDDKGRCFDLEDLIRTNDSVGIIRQEPTACVKLSESKKWLSGLKQDLKQIEYIQTLDQVHFKPEKDTTLESFIQKSSSVVFGSNLDANRLMNIEQELYHD